MREYDHHVRCSCVKPGDSLVCVAKPTESWWSWWQSLLRGEKNPKVGQSYTVRDSMKTWHGCYFQLVECGEPVFHQDLFRRDVSAIAGEIRAKLEELQRSPANDG